MLGEVYWRSEATERVPNGHLLKKHLALRFDFRLAIHEPTLLWAISTARTSHHPFVVLAIIIVVIIYVDFPSGRLSSSLTRRFLLRDWWKMLGVRV